MTPRSASSTERPMAAAAPSPTKTPLKAPPDEKMAINTSPYFLRSVKRLSIEQAAPPSVAEESAASTLTSPEPPTTPSRKRRSQADAPSSRKRRAVVSPYFSPAAKLPNGNPHHPNLPPHLAVHPSFVHPASQYGLVQELLSEDTWALLVATCLLNKTRGHAARPMCWEILRRWPTPKDLAGADEQELSDLLLPLGLFRQRARRLRLFSQQYVDDPPSLDNLRPCRDVNAAYLGPTPIGHLAGVGRYAVESWLIFCGGAEAWKEVRPADKELKKYLEWRWAKEGVKVGLEGIEDPPSPSVKPSDLS